MFRKQARKRTSVLIQVHASRPGVSPVVVLDGETVKRAFYRDASNPAASVWYTLGDANAAGTLVLLPE